MANLTTVIVTDVADLQESEIHKITQKLEETQNKKEMLKRENEALKLVNEQLTTQLNKRTKQLDRKKRKSSNCVVSYKPAMKEECLLSVNRRSSTRLADWTG